MRRFLQFSHPVLDFWWERRCLAGSTVKAFGTSERTCSEFNGDVDERTKVLVQSRRENGFFAVPLEEELSENMTREGEGLIKLVQA